MKKFLILTLLLLSSFFGFSQNGGQFNENNLIRIEYLGYFNGNHKVNVCNKQNCESRIRTKADRDPAVDIIVPANGCVVVLVARPTSASVSFIAKAETSCPNFTNPDMGRIEIILVSDVLNLVDNNYITIVRGFNTYFVSLVGGVLKSNFGSLSENQHIVIYNISGVIFYQRKSFVKKTDQIDLNFCLRPGLNFVRVFIDNKFRDNFTFKIYKN
jgi:hypothetical protein